MARWNKLNEEEYYFSQKTLPPHEIKSAKNTEPIRYDINNYIENDDITMESQTNTFATWGDIDGESLC